MPLISLFRDAHTGLAEFQQTGPSLYRLSFTSLKGGRYNITLDADDLHKLKEVLNSYDEYDKSVIIPQFTEEQADKLRALFDHSMEHMQWTDFPHIKLPND